ncbi:hypothetical protein FisN_16Hh262 [Fistulifera solaris]|uniref:Cyclin N-terminal domain-containing protein n=1 Tax=Fistulifera solaris TaxID=1519565 RepID=A0A1Z5KSK7_FISSO|nr:hypothetical protein FisN_16Hh262 [Fistulifera solaris]|eukprot:GAX29304.1 hypothetical protein FisN_16Hh262 [Fistulifera solaris]
MADSNERKSSAPTLSAPVPIPSTGPSPYASIPLRDDLQPSQSDASTATAPRRRRTAPTVVSNSPAKRQRCYYNLRSSNKKSFSSAELIPAVTPKHITFEEEDVYDIYNGPLVTQEDPSSVWSSQHFTSYGATYLQHQKQKEERECIDLFGTTGPYPSCAVVDAYASDESEWRYRDDDEDEVHHDRYEYRQRILSLKEVSPLDVSTRLPQQPMITAKMRAVLVNWLTEVASEYNVSNTALHLAVTLLDAYLAKGDPESSYDENLIVYRSEFQALGCACLWIASKMEDKTPPEINDLVYISDHSFTRAKLVEIELRVCRTLNFRLHRVTPHHYLDTFLKASHAGDPPKQMLWDAAEYLLELSRLSFDISFRPPSLVAAAALYLARATIGIIHKGRSYWSPTLAHVTQYSLEDIEDTVLMLHKYQLLASESKEFSAIHSKYRPREHHHVALKVPPRFDRLAIDFTICGDVQYEYATISRP